MLGIHSSDGLLSYISCDIPTWFQYFMSQKLLQMMWGMLSPQYYTRYEDEPANCKTLWRTPSHLGLHTGGSIPGDLAGITLQSSQVT